jgi:competence ComEA-like helix-hairpin-helix protein
MDAAPAPAQQKPTMPGSAWSRGVQIAAAFLLGVALTLFFGHVYLSTHWSTRPTELKPPEPSARRIDLNRADKTQLLQVPNIGPALAERIVKHREENGDFHSVDDLKQVHGIGSATLARLKPWLCVSGDADADEPEDDDPTERIKHVAAAQQKKTVASQSSSKKTPSLGEPIDINKATGEELRKLPRIGEKLSQAILDERTKAPFKSVDDLHRVHGIGQKTIDNLRPYIRVGEPVRVASGG